MLISLIVVGLLACSTLALPSTDQQQLVEELQSEVQVLKNEIKNLRSLKENLLKKSGGMQSFASDSPDYSDLKRLKGLPLPRLTKGMDPGTWFRVFEKLHARIVLSADKYNYQKSFLYYIDPEALECNIGALEMSYSTMKSYFRRCN